MKKFLGHLLVSLSLTLFLITNLFTNTSSAQTVTIGTGTAVNGNTSYPAPYGNWYYGAKHQFLIRASELTANCAIPGNITALGFDVATIQGTPLSNFTIRIKSTSATVVTSTFDNTGFITVFGPQTYTETAGWNMHSFITPFNWDGTSNLLIEVCFNNGSYTYNAQTRYTSAGFNSCIYFRQDASGVCGAATGNISVNRPNIRLNMPTTVLPLIKPTKNNINYGNVQLTTFKKDSLYIKNIGCSNLNITNITKQTGNFSISATSGTILPLDSMKLVVTFTPPFTGTFYDTLKVFSNAGDSLISLSGAGVPPPVISVNPLTFNVSINSCNDSVTMPLTINNTGAGTLNFNISSLETVFYDGFESGNFNSWNIGTGTYTRTTSNTQHANGNYSFEITGGNYLYYDGINHTFPVCSADYISFYLMSPAGSTGWNCGVNIGNTADIVANGAIADIGMDNNAMTVYLWCSSGSYQVPMVQGQWYHIEYRNINYTTKRFDYYVNGTLVAANLQFWNTALTNINVVHLFGYEAGMTSYFDDIHIASSLNTWLFPTPTTGTVAPLGSTTVNVKFKSTNIVSGAYHSNLYVISNDPANSTITIPCTLTVNGVPNLNIPLPNSCPKFDTTMVTSVNKDTFLIYNSGCDTLFISNVTTSYGQFVIDTFPASIPPYSSAQMIINFQPTTVANHATTITVQNNDADTSFCLQGVSIPAPTISAVPGSFNEFIACGDSLTDTLIIYNTGGGNLNWSVSSVITRSDDFDPSIDPALWTFNNGFTSTNCGAVSGNALYFNDNGVRQAETIDLNTTGGGNINFYIRLGDGGGTCEYLDPGEDIVLEYSNNAGGIWTNISTYYSGNYFTFTPFSIPIPLAAQTMGTRFRWRQLSHSGSCCDHWALDDISIDSHLTSSVSPSSGTTPPSETDTVLVEFSSIGLNAGQYNTSLTILSNDPINNLLTIPCTVNIFGSPDMHVSLYDVVSPSCLNLDSIMEYTTSIDSVLITNSGCDTLNIDSVVFSPPVFSLSSADLYVAPGNTGKLRVLFSPVLAGNYTGSMSIYTNDIDTVICIKGKSFQRPIETHIPNYFDITLGCNDSITNILTIYNTGGMNLDYTLTGGGAPIIYDQAFVMNQTPVAQATAWVNFRAQLTPHPYNSLTISGSNNPAGITLTDPVVIANIANALRTETYYSATVNGNTWKVNTGCGNGAVLSVNANDCSCDGPAGNIYIIRPEIGNQNWGGINTATCSGPSQTMRVEFKYGESWLNINPGSGTILPGDTAFVSVEFNSTNILIGNYTSNIIINSNDPLNSPDSIPLTLHVVGTPQFNAFLHDSIVNCLDLDSIMEYTTSMDTISVYNTGCDTLFIDSLKFTPSPLFSSISSPSYILPGDTGNVVVKFSPVSAGIFPGNVILYTNDIDPSICLNGKAFPRPIQCHTPSLFNISLPCCDSITSYLKICNSGGTNLIYQIQSSTGDFKPKVLLIENDGYGVDVKNELISTGKFIASDIDVLSSPGSVSMSTLSPYNVVLIWSDNSLPAIIGDTLKKFVDNGGGVVIATYSFNSPWNLNGGIMGSGYAPFVIDGNHINVSGTINLNTLPEPNHPIFKNITVNPTYWYNSNYVNPALDTDAKLLATDMAGNKVVAENANRNVVGMIIYPGNLSIGNASAKLMFANALYYVYNSAPWLSVSPTSDTVTTTTGDTSVVNLVFKSCGINAGTYNTNIIINSNDPLNPKDTIACTLNVIGSGKIELSENCMYLDSIMEFTTKVDSFYIRNTGCDTLKIINITKQTTDFSVNPVSGNIVTGDSLKIFVTFAPTTSPFTFLDTLTILNNDITKKICLSGKSFPKPVQCHSPNLFTEHFTVCQDTLIDTLSICNTGAGNLNYTLWSPYGKSAAFDGNGDWINRNSVNLPTGSVMTVSAWIYPVSYPDPTYNGIVSWGTRGCYGNMLLSIQNNGRPSMANWCNDFTPNTGSIATLNQWNHIACVMNGQSVTLYMNGQPVSGTLGVMPNVQSQNISIGATDYPGRYFNGKIDEVRIYNRALSEAEILAGMYNTLTGNENGLMGYYNFDNGTANDLTVNGNNGTLNGNAAISNPNIQLIPSVPGTVVPSGNNIVQVKFIKTGLPNGTHNYPIILSSNDPLNPIDTINAIFIIDSIAPPPPVASDTNVCFGNPVPSLTALGSSGDTIKWYNSAMTLVYTGNPFNTGQTSVGIYKYYVTSTDSVNGCESRADSVFLQINSAPSEPTAPDVSSCFGAPVPVLNSTGNIPLWFSNSSLTTLVHTGTPFNTGLTAAGIYTFYVADSTGGCPKSPADTAKLTIYALPGIPIANDTSVCVAGPIPSLTATVTGTDSIRWYNSSMIFVGSGNSYNTGQTTPGSYKYYVTSVDTATGCESARDSVTLNILNTAQPISANASACFGSSIPSLSATGTNILWYDSTMALAFTGNPYNTGLTAVGTYAFYVTQTLNGCESTPLPVTLTINPIPSVPVAPDKNSCFGQTTPSLTATGTNIKWYDDAALTSLVAAGSPYNTGMTVPGNYTYYVTQTASGCPSVSDTVYLTIYALPSRPVAANQVVCFGNPTPDLVATSTTGNDTVHWYNSPALTPVLFTGNPFTTGQTTVGSYTYYVTQTDTVTGCRSNPDTVSLTINNIPNKPTINDLTICFGSSAILSSTGTIPQWYNNTALTPVLYTGNNYNTGLTAVGSYTFYITDSISGCPQSPADTAILTINPTPAAPVASPQSSAICFGQTNPSYSAAGTNIEWWSDPSLTILAFAGDPFTPSVTTPGTYSYYVTQTTGSCMGQPDTITLTINSLPVVDLGTDSTRCGGSITLNAGNPGSTYLWSTTETGQSIVVSSSGIYDVLVTNTNGCTNTDTVNITILPLPVAPIAVPQSNTICSGDPNPSFTAAGTSIEWWSNPSLTTLEFAGDPFTPSVTTPGTYTYYVTQTTTGCRGPSDTVLFTINYTPAPVANDVSVVSGNPVPDLTSTGSNIQWYDTSMAPVYTGSPYPTGQTAIGIYTYYVSQMLNGCESLFDTVVLTIYPGAPATTDETVCFGQVVPDLTATGTNIQWFSDPLLTTLVGTGSPFATGQTAAGSYIYYVTQTINSVQSPSDTVVLTINSLPSAPASSNQSACFGGTIPDLTATGTNIQWYDTSMTPVFSGSPFSTGQTAIGMYIYHMSQTVSGCESPTATDTLTINALPATPIAGNDTAICYGYPVPDLTSTGTNITWYDTTGAVVGNGSPFATGQTAPGVYTYIVTQTNSLTTCESLGDTVILSINSTTPPVAPDVTICSGNPVPPLTATGTNIQWYDTSMTLVFSGSTFNTGLTAVGTYTYYVSQTNTVSGCASPMDTVYLIISSPPTLAPTVQDTGACFGSLIPDLVATTGTIINWYSDASLTNLVFSGNPFTTGMTSVGTYNYFATDSTPGCPEGPSTPVTLVINALPATLIVNDTSACFGSTIPDFVAIGTNVQWYDTSMIPVYSGNTFSTGQTAAGNYTYIVTQSDVTTGCSSLPDSATLAIHSLPPVPTALDTTVCSAAIIPNLTATGNNIQWYDTAGVLVFTGNSFATGQTATGVHTYFVSQTDALTGCASNSDTSTLTILLSPPAPFADDVAVCTGNPVPFLTSTGTNVMWYSDAALTNLVNTGNSFNTGQINVGTYTFYVTDSLSGCTSSASDTVTLYINPVPSEPDASDLTLCYGDVVILMSTGNNPQWYSDITLINMIGTGNSFNLGQKAVGSYTYYVADYAAGCGKSPADTVLLTINPKPLVTANTFSTSILPGDSVTLIAYNALTYVWTPPAGLNTTTGSTVIASPSVSTTYTVTGTNAYGCSSDTSIFVLLNPIGINEVNTALEDLKIYPNPASKQFTIEFSTYLSEPIHIYLNNILGEKVMVMEIKGTHVSGLKKYKYDVETRSLADGFYSVEIVTSQGSVSAKIVLKK